jgi:phosphoribosyl-ATP pyrophosphohydrolase/phosphoribosyl-AMP cyclohydrolase
MSFSISGLNFEKGSGLLPAIIQDVQTGKVLMLGHMNEEALTETFRRKKVTFFSRSKQRLWTKGETSGNFLHLVDVKPDCDGDTLLITARPAGPTCHTGSDTCFDEVNEPATFLRELETVIKDRQSNPSENSYTTALFQKGLNKIAQKVGEEAVELIIESKDDDKRLFLNEAADLMYHFLVLLAAKGYSLTDVEKVLMDRHKK